MNGDIVNVNEKQRHHFLYLLFPGLLGLVYSILGIVSLNYKVSMNLVSIIIFALIIIVTVVFEILLVEKSKNTIINILYSCFCVLQRMCLSIIITMFLYSVISIFIG